MRASILMAASALALAACAPTTPPEPGPGPGGGPAPWRCDANDARSLIGSHVGAVTFAPNANVRIACTTCPVTRDYRPDRLNLRFNEATGIIESVDCG